MSLNVYQVDSLLSGHVLPACIMILIPGGEGLALLFIIWKTLQMF